jgi:CheY-like chemotaxis protein
MSAEIVIIEDDPSIAELLSELLELEGYRVATFADGTTLEPVIAAAPRLIFLDLMLPFADGDEICRRLRADPRSRTTPIFLMTAASCASIARRLRNCDHDGLLQKPFDIDDLLTIAARYVHRLATPPPLDTTALDNNAW